MIRSVYIGFIKYIRAFDVEKEISLFLEDVESSPFSILYNNI